MLSINFPCIDAVTDALYQWDLNQAVEITDVTLTADPTIHFCNKKSTTALVVIARISNHVLTCPIPNVLLEEPYDITGYLYTNTDDKGKTIQAFKIPIIKRAKPSSYAYEDNIPLMTYEAIEADIDTKIAAASNGDMRKAVYDTNDNGIVDNAEKLGGNLPAYYSKQSDLTSEIARAKAAEVVNANAITDEATRATAAEAALSAEIGTGTGVKMVLVWQNASPTSTFNAQTVNIDLSEYDRVHVSCYYNAGSAGSAWEVNGECNVGCVGVCASPVSASASLIRVFRPTATGVSFDNTVGATSVYMIPQRIYGIKGVQNGIS